MRIYFTFLQKSQEILLLSFAKADIIKSDSETTTILQFSDRKEILRQTLAKQESGYLMIITTDILLFFTIIY